MLFRFHQKREQENKRSIWNFILTSKADFIFFPKKFVFCTTTFTLECMGRLITFQSPKKKENVFLIHLVNKCWRSINQKQYLHSFWYIPQLPKIRLKIIKISFLKSWGPFREREKKVLLFFAVKLLNHFSIFLIKFYAREMEKQEQILAIIVGDGVAISVGYDTRD